MLYPDIRAKHSSAKHSSVKQICCRRAGFLDITFSVLSQLPVITQEQLGALIQWIVLTGASCYRDSPKITIRKKSISAIIYSYSIFPLHNKLIALASFNRKKMFHYLNFQMGENPPVQSEWPDYSEGPTSWLFCHKRQ